MSGQASLILKILKVELEEVENDVAALEQFYEQRFRKDEITNYVWQENKALLAEEICCVKHLVKDLEAWKPPEAVGADDLLSLIRDFLYSLIDARRYPGLVRAVVDRKIEKVARYVD